MSTAVVSESTETSVQSVDAMHEQRIDLELSVIVRRIKEHEAIAFHQLGEIGEELNRAAVLCLQKGTSFETWVQQNLSYAASHAYRLRRFADRINSATDQRVLNVFERASNSALWLLMSAPDAVIHEVDNLMEKTGKSATRKQVDAIKAKYDVNKKVAQASLDIVTAVVENSLDQDIEVRALQSKIEKLTHRLEEETNKVARLDSERTLLRVDVETLSGDNEAQMKKIVSLEMKAAVAPPAPKADERDAKRLADAKRELETTEKKLQTLQTTLAVEQQRVASINQLVDATNAWLKEVSPNTFAEVLVGLSKGGRDTLMSVLNTSEKQIATLKKLLS